MRPALCIGSRGSKLAQIQSEWIAERLRAAAPGVEVSIEIISTKGDRVLDKPLAEIGGKGLFTQELESALRDGSIDLAVHSLKDLPTDDPAGLVICAIPKRATPNDALVCANWGSLAELPKGARVGTSSLRRAAQLRAIAPGLEILDLRGNVDTRLAKVLERGELDAAILACAGLERLGRTDAIAEVLAPELMLPAPGQGALGIQSRADDGELLALLKKIDHEETRAEVSAERALLAALGGGCQVPIGALARVDGDALRMDACVCTLDGQTVLRHSASGTVAEAEALGRTLADALLADGADAIVAELA